MQGGQDVALCVVGLQGLGQLGQGRHILHRRTTSCRNRHTIGRRWFSQMRYSPPPPRMWTKLKMPSCSKRQSNSSPKKVLRFFISTVGLGILLKKCRLAGGTMQFIALLQQTVNAPSYLQPSNYFISSNTKISG